MKLIKEFEDGIVSEAVETSNDLYGQQTSTHGVESNQYSTSPMKKLKRNPRKQHWVSKVHGVTSFIVILTSMLKQVHVVQYALFFNLRAFVNDSTDLTCKTEKDKHGRLNFRTAGQKYIM